MTLEEYRERILRFVATGDMAGAQRALELASLELPEDQVAELAGLMSGTYPNQRPPDPLDTQNQVLNAFEERQPESDFYQAVTDPESPAGERVTPEESAAAQIEGFEIGEDATQVQPPWIWEVFGRELTAEERSRIVDEVNLMYGESFESWEELRASQYLDQPWDDVKFHVTNAVRNIDPTPAFEVQLGGNRTLAVRKDEFEVVQQRWGLDTRELQRLIRVSDQYGLRNGDRLSWQVVLALGAATGVLDRLTTDSVPGPPGTFGGNIDWARDLVPSYTRPDQAAGVPDVIARLEGIEKGPQRVAFKDVIQDFQKGLELFGYDPGVAFIYAFDPALATRAARTGGDLSKMLPRDQYRISGIIAQAGFKSRQDWRQTMISAGFAEAELTGQSLFEGYWAQMEAAEARADRRTAGADDGPATEAIQRIPDPEGVDETLRQLYMQMFDVEPDQATLARFRANVNAAARSEELGSVDISARARQFAREDPLYDELYGNRPGGMLEEEYRGMFEAAQASMLGAELAGNVAVRAGMRSGQYQTTVGAAAATAEAWDNSTFLGRLARAADVVGANT